MSEGNGKSRERIRPAISGAKYDYMLSVQGDVTAVEAADIAEFMFYWSLRVVGAIAPDMIDKVFAQTGDGTKRHFAIREKSGIVVPGRG